MSEHRDEKHYLNDILESIAAIEIYLENMNYKEFIHDRKTCSATIRELEIIGEAVGKISSEIKSKYSDVLWQPIKDFRNKIVHEYFGIDYRMVWDIVKNELPILNSQMSDIIKGLT
jgi:uncharacterized protein with HEPN domain